MTACKGILSRAERRNKELPELLRIALEKQIEKGGKDGIYIGTVEDEAMFIENHPNDSRVGIADTCQTLTGRMGTGGNNVPLVMNKEVAAFSSNAGPKFDIAYAKELAPTLLAERYDASAVICIHGNLVSRKNPRLNGSGWTDKNSFTLTTVDRHAVAYEKDTEKTENEAEDLLCVASQQANAEMCKDKAPTLTAAAGMSGNNQPYIVKEKEINSFREGGFGEFVEDNIAGTLKASGGMLSGGSETLLTNKEYVVRKLTPLECCRLQGFSDEWEKNIAIENPTDEEMAFWKEVFDTFSETAGKKTKTEDQIRKWLKAPYSESASYKMWGNGIAEPTALYIMEGFAEALKNQ